MRTWAHAVIGTALLWGGCSGVSPRVVNGEFEAQIRSREGPYLVKPEDVLSVIVIGHPEYSKESAKITADGHIDTPLGRFYVSGKTVPEVQALIESAQAEFPDTRPPILVELREQGEEIVWVGGEVFRPGVVKLLPGMSALEAVMEAGGNKPSGKLREILLIRRAGERTRAVRRVDLKVLEEDLVLLPRDIVYVPRTVIADVYTFVDEYITRPVPFNQYAIYAALGLRP